MKKICIFLLCIFLMTSCVYWGMYHFGDDDLVWLTPYDEGDTILFRSETNGMDTLVVNEKYVKDTMEAYGFLDIDLWHDSQSFFSGISITKVKGGGLRVSLPFTRIKKVPLESELKMQQKQIGEKKYTDVFVCTRTDSIFYSKNSPPVQFYLWSKSKGLLQYKYLNGDVYTFYKKIPRKK